MSRKKDDTFEEFELDEDFSINSVYLDEFRRRKQHSSPAPRPDKDSRPSSYRQSDDPGGGLPAQERTSVSFPAEENDCSENYQFPTDGDDYGAGLVNAPIEKPARSGKIWVAVFFLILGIGAVFLMKQIIDKNQSNSISQFDYPDPVTISDLIISSSDSTTTVTSTKESTTTETSVKTEYHTLRLGDNNDDVKKMQVRLKELGYIDSSSCTGYYGDFTKKIVKRFQKKVGIKVTGIADPETLRILYSDDAPVCK